MRQISTTAFLGILALTITGCPSSNNPQTVNPTPTTAPVVQTPPSVKPPLIAQNPSVPIQLAPGLIQPTNANQRTKQVAKGNKDPFTALYLPVPVSPISSGNTAFVPNQAPQIPTPTTVSSRQTIRTQGTSTRTVNNRQSRPNTVAINNPTRTTIIRKNSSSSIATSNQNSTPLPTTTLPNNNLQPALPIAPQEPELAKNVTVMGVIQIGEQTQAIVQVPSEATSRYVQVGQRLSNGQVLVKRIELNAGAEPLVVLEQYGVEVSKAVGEIAPSPGQPTAALPVPTQSTNAPTAAVPYLPPQSTNAPTAELPAPPQNINAPTAAIPAAPPQNINAPTAAIPAAPPQNINAPTAAIPAAPLQNINAPTAIAPYPPMQNTNAPTAATSTPLQNINISGINLSGAQPLPNAPTTLTK